MKENLDTLRASSIAEDDGSFDPSGTSSTPIKDRNNVANSPSSETESASTHTALSALSLGSGSGTSSSQSETHTLDEYANLSNDAKLSMLTELFPTLRTGDVTFVLRKYEYDVGKAMDVLLNHVFFEDSSKARDGEIIVSRGIDAFAENNHTRRGRPKKNKAKKFQTFDEPIRSSSVPSETASNKWDTANKDVLFISSRVKLPAASVASLYHKQGGSQRKTIIALIEDNLQAHKGGDRDEDLQVEAYGVDLVQDFPTLSFEYCSALIRLTSPSTANAHELAKALIKTSEEARNATLLPHYAPLQLTESSLNTRTASPSTTAITGDSRTILTARSTAFGNASKYYRKGKSDRLMGGAAAYYSSLGRDYSAALHTATAAESDALVTSQSSATQVDLHGVTVKEATRIACERTQLWWDGLGETRIPGGGRNIGHGLRIVTGVGRHSERGVAKLGPAVMRVLLADGWRIEVGTGVLTVTGRMKR